MSRRTFTEKATSPPDAHSPTDNWHLLATGPRALPFTSKVSVIGGTEGILLNVLWFFAAFLTFGFQSALATAAILALPVAGMAIIFMLRTNHRRILRDGLATYARIDDVEKIPSGDTYRFKYTLQYTDTLGQTHDTTHTIDRQLRGIQNDAFKPLLFTEDGAVMFFDEVPHLTVSEDGQLVSNVLRGYIGVLGPLLFIIALFSRG